MSEMTGRVLEGYRIDAELGRGGQAVVYRATQLSLQRTVALKVVSSTLSSDEHFKERFTREGIAAASLDHPHVIPVFEAGEADGLAFLAMKYIDGPSFDAVLRQPGGVEPRRTLSILHQVAEALDYVAARDMVHRDVKPANILLGPGDHAYLSDFGLIKAMSASKLTSSGVWMGTLEYVAPEQIRGGEITAAADRYALAALAFEALTGRAVFPREDRTATLFAHVNDAPPAATSANPGLGAEVDAVLNRGLAKNPADRHASSVEFISALSQAVMATPGAAEARPPLAAPAAPPPPPVAPTPPAPVGATITDGAATVPPRPLPEATGPAATPSGDSATVSGDASDDGPTAPPTGGSDGDGRTPPSRKALALVAGGGIAAILVIVVIVMAATGAFSGGDRTTTTYVLDTTARVVTSPAGDVAGAIVPSEVPGWSVEPAPASVPNLDPPAGAEHEAASFTRGSQVALVTGIRTPDGDAARALTALSSQLEGTAESTPTLGPDADGAWAKTVVDGAAVAFATGDKVLLVLAPDLALASELARQITSD